MGDEEEKVGTDWKEALELIQTGLEKEDSDVVLANCRRWYQDDEVPSDVQSTLLTIYLRSLLDDEEDYQQVVDICAGQQKREEYAYALYRLKDYRACLQLLDEMNDQSSSLLFCLHLRSQCHYRLKETQLALDAYQEILTKVKDDKHHQQEYEETISNICAVGIANDYYHYDGIKSAVDQILSSHSSEDDDYPYELAYNYGMWLALQRKNDNEARSYLLLALQHATTEEERMAIQFTLQQFSEDDEDVASSYPHLNWVVQHQKSLSTNKATLLKPQDITLLHLTPSQVRKFWFNQCLISLSNQKKDQSVDDGFFLSLLDQLLSHVDSSTKKKKAVLVNKCHELYWSTKVAILYHCYLTATAVKKKKSKKKLQSNVPTLEEMEELLLAQNSEGNNNDFDQELLDLSNIHLQLYKLQTIQKKQGTIAATPETISILESLPSRPAIQATLASLYQQSGQPHKVQNILKSLKNTSSDNSNNSLAMLYMQMNMYPQALKLLEADDNDETTTAMKVILFHQLGKVDDALDEWNSFRTEQIDEMLGEELVDGEALEADTIPRLYKSSVIVQPSKRYVFHTIFFNQIPL